MAAGWVGAGLTLLAYGLLVMRRLESGGPWFNGMNVLGGLLLLGSAVAAGAMPNVVLNVVWVVAGTYGLIARGRASRRSHALVDGRGGTDESSPKGRSGSLG